MSKSNAVALNTKACALMCVNKFQEATTDLIAALRLIQSTEEKNSNSSHHEKVNAKDLLIRPVRIATDHQDQSFFHIYNWALVIIGNIDHEDVQDVSRICAVILYNLGLCFQAIAMEEEMDRTSLDKAFRMYDAASMLLDSSGCTEWIARLAIMNNKGCIMACCYSDYGGAQECLGTLQYLLTTVDGAEEIDREDILEIRMNVALVYGRHAHAGAA
jgi:hypothetical protein